ncbi:helix-turn-helix transcriptional regulator [Bradyrhizobium sp. th.b2]|uniref:helix-turn-helix domain-containing protein n=1 Tax=Bradyrhizobium sp. th-b2 TaxID=172088 RepID=UPI0003FFB61B|nr:helix-turn-helix transcriptional regulator [Bradyrhizobium sp. th.b2]
MRTQQTETTETFLNNAAFLPSLRLPALVDDEVPVPAGDEAGRRRTPATAALDAYEEKHLKAGGKVEASPDQPKVPYWKAIAAKVNLPASLLAAKHLPYRKRILALAVTYGLEPAPIAPTPLPFADFAMIAVAHRERELEEEGADGRAQKLAVFTAVMQDIEAECDPDQDARDVLVSVVTSAGAGFANKSAVFFNEANRALGYVGNWDANEGLPRNPAHLLRYALARSGLSQSKVANMAGTNQATLSNWLTGKRGPIEAHFARVNLVEKALDLPHDSLTSRFGAWRRQARPARSTAPPTTARRRSGASRTRTACTSGRNAKRPSSRPSASSVTRRSAPSA